MPRLSTGTIAAAVLAAAVTGTLFWRHGPGPSPDGASETDRALASHEEAGRERTAYEAPTASSPFDVVDGRAEAGSPDGSSAGAAAAVSAGSAGDGPGDTLSRLDSAPTGPIAFDTPFDVASVGAAVWTDADFYRDAARLSADPDALALVIESFRAETDPARLTKLASLLGEVGHADLVAIGADMASSGNAASREAGLDLLQRIQPTDEGAREVLVGLLASESDPVVLKSVIDAVSIPGQIGSDSADALVAQLVPLTRHESAAVRRNGVTVLSRWAADENVTPVLRAALDDPDRGVRSSAVYAFADYPLVDESVREDLLAVLENRDEEAGIRSGALLALQRTELDGEQARRLETARREMNRRRPANPP